MVIGFMIALIGECMIECVSQNNDMYKLAYGGDTLNTAVYMSRCGGQCDFFTVLGDDEFSTGMLNSWIDEGVGTSKVRILAGRLPGMYVIENDSQGERRFYHWRKESPARNLLQDFPEVLDELMQYESIFLTGITLSIFSENDRELLFKFLATYRKSGGQVIFDNNYRAKNWSNNKEAIETYNKMMLVTNVALLSFDDEIEMYGEHSHIECFQRWKNAGTTEIIIKQSEKGCFIYKNDEFFSIPVKNVVKPIDTTAAGDSFNGAFLAARQQGFSVEECIQKAQFCASVVIMNKGAIIDPKIKLNEVDV